MPACRDRVASNSWRSSGRRRSAAIRRRARPAAATGLTVGCPLARYAGRSGRLGALAQWSRPGGWAPPVEIAAQLGAEAALARGRRLEDQVGEQPQHEPNDHPDDPPGRQPCRFPGAEDTSLVEQDRYALSTFS